MDENCIEEGKCPYKPGFKDSKWSSYLSIKINGYSSDRKSFNMQAFKRLENMNKEFEESKLSFNNKMIIVLNFSGILIL